MFIGDKKIKETVDTKEKTPSGIDILKVEFEDGSAETFSKMMYDKIVSGKPCDASELRDKRVYPVVEAILVILREWGLKVGDTPYLSSLLNKSLNFNSEEAQKLLWKEFLPTIQSLDDVDTITVDRVLKSRSGKVTLQDVLGDKKSTK